MDFNKLVQLLENEKTWKETNIYKKELQKDNMEIVEGLINNLDTIISDKKQKPMVKLGAIRLFKNCLEAGQDYYNIMISDHPLVGKLAEYAKIKENKNIFSNAPDKREQQVSVTFFTYIVEGFIFWARWFPDTKFKEYYDQLKKHGVKFPDVSKLQLFKSDLLDLYVNGQFKNTGQQNLQQSQPGNIQQSQLRPGQTPTQGGSSQGPKLSVEQIQEKISEYDSMRDLVVEMLENNEDDQVDLQMFTESFHQFSAFTDNLFRSGNQLSDQLQEQIIEKGEQCNDLCAIFEQFYSQNIPYKDMKSQVIKLCKKQQQPQQDNQKQLREQEEYLRRQQQEQEQIEYERQLEELEQHRREEEERNKKEKEERRRQEEKQFIEQMKIQDDQKQQEEQAKQRKLKEEEEQAKQKKLKEEEEQRQLQLKNQKEKEEKEKQKQKQLEEERQQKLLQEQKLQQEQRALQEQQQLQEQKILQEQKLFQEQLKQEELHRQQENQKKKDIVQHHQIPEDKREYDDEEERKSTHLKNKNESGQQKMGLYNTPEMMQLKNQNNPEQSMPGYMQKPLNAPAIQAKQSALDSRGSFGIQPNQSDQLMGFDQEDDFMNDDPKQSNKTNQQQKSQSQFKPASHTQISQQQLNQQSNSQFGSMRMNDAENSNNAPYQSMGQAKKNPFTNQSSSASQNVINNAPLQVKKNESYFGDEEIIEPSVTQVHQTKVPQQNPLAIQSQQQQQLRESQRVNFEASNNIDEEEEEEKEEAKTYGHSKNKQQYNAQLPTQKKQVSHSKLDQSGTLDQSMNDSPHKTQFQYLQNNVAPKLKTQEEKLRQPANPNISSSQVQQHINSMPFTKLEQKPLSSSHISIKGPSGFEQVPFGQQSQLKAQINQSQDLQRSQLKSQNDQMNQSRFLQALNQESKSYLRDPHEDRMTSTHSFTDGRKVAVFSKSGQGEIVQLKQQLIELRREKDLEISKLQTQINQLNIKNRDADSKTNIKHEEDGQLALQAAQDKQQLIEIRREKDLEISKLQTQINQLNNKNRDLESKISFKNEQDGQITLQVGQDKQEYENRIQEKDKTIFQQKQYIEQQTRDIDQSNAIIKQFEQQKIEQQQIFLDKKKQMEAENQKTREQLQDYINSSQKQHNSQIEQMQRSLNLLEEENVKYQQDLQQRELENSEIRNELRLLKSKESNFNPNFIREKDQKIQEVRSKMEILSKELEFNLDKIKDLQSENLILKKNIDDAKGENTAIDSQIQIYKENIMQKEIKINQLQQTIFDKDQQILNKDQSMLQLDQTVSKQKDIIEQFKGSSESQIKKFNERIDEQELEIKNLSKEKFDLENRLDNLSLSCRQDMDRIVQASKLTEDEKKSYKSMIEEIEKLRDEQQKIAQKEQNYLAQISSLQKTVQHLKKENELHESNMEDLVMANNLVTKKLYERDEQFLKEHEVKLRDNELKEKRYNQELENTRKELNTLKLEKQRREQDLNRNIDTLRKENDLLVTNIKTRQQLSPERQLRSQVFSPTKYEHDNEIDRATNTMSLNDRADRNIQNSQINLQGNYNPGNSALQNTNYIQYMSPVKQQNDGFHNQDDIGLMNPLSAHKQHNYASNVHSSNSLQTKKNYPHLFFGKELSFNPTYFSYLNADRNQLHKFKKCCLKNKMTIYQDNYLNVGVLTEISDIDGKQYLLMTIYFENKSINSQLSNVQITYEGDQSVNVFKKPTTLPDIFIENSQHQQQIITDFNDMPYKMIQCVIKYTVHNHLNQGVFPLPNSINKYFEPVTNITPQSINQAFNQYSNNIICTEEIKVDKNIASSQYDYTNSFPGFINLGIVEGTQDYQTIGSQLVLKNTDTHIWMKINYNKKDHRVVFQTVYSEDIEDHTLNIVRYLLQTYMMIFKE